MAYYWQQVTMEFVETPVFTNPTSTCSKYAKPVFGGYGNKMSGDIKMRVS
jgi:hypothetical protein